MGKHGLNKHAKNMAKQRLVEFDILRGLLIIAVVMGHTPWWEEGNRHIFWFHMPAFFMVSGYFMRELCCDGAMLRRRARRLLVPYVAWSVVMWCLLHPEPLWKNALRAVFGYYNGVYSYPYWFVIALMTSLVAFSFLRKAKSGGNFVCSYLLRVGARAGDLERPAGQPALGH